MLDHLGIAPLGHEVLVRQTGDIFPIETGGAEARIAHAHSRGPDQLLEAVVADQVHAQLAATPGVENVMTTGLGVGARVVGND